MEKGAEGQELLEGLAAEVATAYQTERPMLLEQLQGKIGQPTTTTELVQSVVRGTTFDYLKMLHDTKIETYHAFLQSQGCAKDDQFADKIVSQELLKSNGFDIAAEAQALETETNTSVGNANG